MAENIAVSVRASVFLLALLLFIPCVSAEAFRFVVLPDMHINCSEGSFTDLQQDAVDAVISAAPSFVISVGDLIDARKEKAGLNPACVRDMWSVAQSEVISPLSSAGGFFFSPGLQDAALDYFGAEAKKIYGEVWSGFSNRGYPINGEYGGYYSFDFGDAHFVSLFAPGSPGLLYADAQLEWLRADLSAARARSKVIFTFANSPLYSPALSTSKMTIPAKGMLQNDARLMALLKEFKVDAHFGGFSHVFEEQSSAGVRDIISGYLGGFVPSIGGQVSEMGFLVVDVDGDKFRTYFIKAPDFATYDLPSPPQVEVPEPEPYVPDSVSGVGICPPGFRAVYSSAGLAPSAASGVSSSPQSSVLAAAVRYEGRAYGTGPKEFTSPVFVEQVLRDVGVDVSGAVHDGIFMVSDRSPEELAASGSPLAAGVQYALVKAGLGSEISPSNAQPGDLIQYWVNEDGVWKSRPGVISAVVSPGIFDLYGAFPEKGIVTTLSNVVVKEGNSKVFIVRVKEAGKSVSPPGLSPAQPSAVGGCGKNILAVGASVTVGCYVAELRKLCPDSVIKNDDNDPNTLQENKDGGSPPANICDYVSCVGKNTGTMRSDFQKALATGTYDTVIIMGGVNDVVGMSFSAERVKSNLLSMYRSAKAAGLRVVAGTITPTGGNKNMTDAKQKTIEEINRWIMTEAPVDVRVDAYSALVDPKNPGAQRKELVDASWLHPKGEGRDILAKAFYDALMGAPSVPSAPQAAAGPVSAVSCLPESLLPKTIYDFVITSKDGLTTILGIARQNLAVGINKTVPAFAPGACLKFAADRQYDLSYLTQTYGGSKRDVEPQLRTVKFLGRDIRVHSLVAPVFGCVEKRILECEEAKGYEFRSIESFSWQAPSDSPDLLAASSFGISVSINMDTNPASDSELVSDLPGCVVSAFKDYGFRWGGDYADKRLPSLFVFMADHSRISFAAPSVPSVVGALPRESGQRVILYATGTRKDMIEFKRRADAIAKEIGAVVYPVASGQDMLDAVSRHDRIEKLIILGHGLSRAFIGDGTYGIHTRADSLPSYASVETFAKLLAPRLNQGAIVSFAACSTGANPGEKQDWSARSYAPGGERSFAAKLRDALAVQPGIRQGIEIRAHTNAGHTTQNPAIRYFIVDPSQVGRPGRSPLEDIWGAGSAESKSREWANLVEGEKAEDWISGGDVSVA